MFQFSYHLGEKFFEESGVGSRESGIGSRESRVGNRESGVGSRGAFRWLETLLHKHQRKISH
ncbi:MAG: hypothetical protein F6K55_37030 [Moorea sp. SIO4A3]|nr:hypothetical protein [Moorena sp. SIO4A3]